MAGLDRSGQGSRSLNMDAAAAVVIVAQVIRVSGVVQGVGFRPFVWRLAQELSLAGWVRNDAEGVEIAVEGEAQQLAALRERLRLEAPPLARIDAVHVRPVAASGGSGFVIAATAGGELRTAIGPDSATCGDCLAELCDPRDRRYRHSFITCTHCGPRYTVTHGLPYDRSRTSLADFPLCADCAREYASPGDRRYAAETICCPNCGPRLMLCDASGRTLPGDSLAATLELLRAGRIVAIKGLGGFHLVCDAKQPQVVAELRRRKAREEKPFALLFANLASVRPWAEIEAGEAALLESPERPIVLLRKRAGVEAPGIADGLAWLGALLPATPIQVLLFHEAAGRPEGSAWLRQAQGLVLVATSANPGGEPLVTDNDEALSRLSGIADAFLLHDRGIVVRCDDSVMRGGQFIRRARGYTPRAIKLARARPSVLALGGWFKNTVCVTRGDEAFVSQHVGDLDNAASCRFFEESVARLLELIGAQPQIVAHDLHPDFHSSRYAARFAAERGIPALAVQHHHAHIAAVLAEHRHLGPALGLALDGVGLGSDGQAWGGELLRVDGATCAQLGHLAPLPLPGGDRAAREPWRMAAAALWRLGRGAEIARRYAAQPAAGQLLMLLERGLNCPPTSSLGRCFDAAAGLLGLRALSSFEGQAALLLEGLAESAWPQPPLSDGYRLQRGEHGQLVLDLLPLLGHVADAPDGSRTAARFHATLAQGLADWVRAAVEESHIATVALAGGCLLNAILSHELCAQLARSGINVLVAQALPPNDGGISLGQAWVALNSLDSLED